MKQESSATLEKGRDDPSLNRIGEAAHHVVDSGLKFGAVDVDHVQRQLETMTCSNIARTIGTGLFLGSGGALVTARALLRYMLVWVLKKVGDQIWDYGFLSMQN
ncbi:hypothetical protein C8J56DRAFT_885519 [Mycena floridula]|nr:hypothetical protein C8J56DRAFT_885519 [Mycena floridula]